MPTLQGFGFKPLTPEEFTDRGIEYSAITRGNVATGTKRWSKEKILTTLGFLNTLIYRAAKEMKLLVQVKKAFRKKNYQQSGFHRVTDQVKTIAARGIKSFRCGMQATSLYLKKFWEGASTSRTQLWKTKKMLSEVFGLFTCEERTFKAGQWGKATVIQDFDFAGALLLYEHLEDLLRRHYADEKDGFDGLPEHKGAIVVLLFNKFFAGIARYRRLDRGETKEEAKREENDNQRAESDRDCFVKPRHFTFQPGCEYLVMNGKKFFVAFAVHDDGTIMSLGKARELWRQKFTRRDADPAHQVWQPFPELELPY